MVRGFQIVNGSTVPSEAPDCPIQVFVNPDAEERKRLLTSLDIDEHALASALDPDEVSRVEFEPGRVFLIWKRPTNYSGGDTFFFDVASIGLVLDKDRLSIISAPDIDLAASIIRPKQTASSPLDVMLSFLLSTVHHYTAHLRIIKTIARELEEKISTSMENKHLLQMFNLSESLVYFLNAINGNSVALTRLRTYAEKQGYSPEVLELLDDLAIENNQCFKQAEIYSSVLSGLMDARGTLVNNNMNVLLKNLTIINVVFLPLNLIASILGMSEFSTMTQNIDWRISYSLFTLVMMIVGWLTVVIIKRLGPDSKPKRFTGTKRAK